jgi:hypothetical protein
MIEMTRRAEQVEQSSGLFACLKMLGLRYVELNGYIGSKLESGFKGRHRFAHSIVRSYNGPTSYRTKSSYDRKINIKVR